jgi:hypothetical protein
VFEASIRKLLCFHLSLPPFTPHQSLIAFSSTTTNDFLQIPEHHKKVPAPPTSNQIWPSATTGLSRQRPSPFYHLFFTTKRSSSPLSSLTKTLSLLQLQTQFKRGSSDPSIPRSHLDNLLVITFILNTSNHYLTHYPSCPNDTFILPSNTTLQPYFKLNRLSSSFFSPINIDCPEEPLSPDQT